MARKSKTISVPAAKETIENSLQKIAPNIPSEIKKEGNTFVVKSNPIITSKKRLMTVGNFEIKYKTCK